MISGKLLLVVLVLLVPGLLAVGGAAAGSAWGTGVGCAVVLGGLGVMIEPGVPRTTRVLLRAGLLALAVAVVLRVSVWTDETRLGPSELLALVSDPELQQGRYLRKSAEAGALILACVLLGAALVRASGKRWLRISAGVALAGVALLARAAWLAVGAARLHRPETGRQNAFLQPGVQISVAVEAGPVVDVGAAAAVATLLLGAGLTVLACARLAFRA